MMLTTTNDWPLPPVAAEGNTGTGSVCVDVTFHKSDTVQDTWTAWPQRAELTKKETILLKWLAFPTPMIAEKTGMKVRNIEKHVENMNRKCGSYSRLNLIRILVASRKYDWSDFPIPELPPKETAEFWLDG